MFFLFPKGCGQSLGNKTAVAEKINRHR
jgi:hypothetical protein